MAMTKVRPGRATRALFKPRARTGRFAGPAPLDDRSAIIDCAAYIDCHRVQTGGVVEAVRLVRTPHSVAKRRFVWVDLHEPDSAELESLADVFGLHPLAVEDAIDAHQRPKLERYDDVLFFVLKTVGFIEREQHLAEVVETGDIMLFCGPDFVVTVRHGDHVPPSAVRRRLEADPQLLANGPGAVLYAVSDHVVDEYISVAESVQHDIDEVEVSVFSAERTSEVERIYRLKREVIGLKRAVGPLAAPVRTLIARRFVPEEIREYLRDVEDHLTRVREQVESCDELLTPILQAHLTQVTVADNQDMRKISAWVAIMAVPTAVAGIYGMNFEFMPETKWEYGYPVVLGTIAVLCILLHRGFRRNGWL